MLKKIAGFIEKYCQAIGEASGWAVRPSKIHGHGVFTNKQLNNDDIIGLMLKGIKSISFAKFRRTTLGRYVNHHPEANVILQKHGNDYYLVANRSIEKDEELVTDYTKYYDLMNQEQEEQQKPVLVE